MLGIAIGTLVLAAAIWLVGRHEAEFDMKKLVLIALGLNVVGAILLMLLASVLHPLLALAIWFVAVCLLAAWAIHTFVYLMWRDAVIASVIYMVIQIGINIGLQMAMGRA